MELVVLDTTSLSTIVRAQLLKVWDTGVHAHKGDAAKHVQRNFLSTLESKPKHVPRHNDMQYRVSAAIPRFGLCIANYALFCHQQTTQG